MIVCAQCGEGNAQGAEFCGSCGTYLEWEGKPAAQRQQSGQPAAGQPVAGQPAAGQPVAGPPDVGRPEVRQPGAMRPDAEAERAAAPRPQVRLTERREPRPGDLICGQCGEANVPTRRFCVRCGSSLVEAQVVERKWWQKLFGTKEAAKAGTRRRRRAGGAKRGIGRVLRWFLVVVLLGGGGLYGLHAPFRQAVNGQANSVVAQVEDWFSNDAIPVRPEQVTATAESPGHSALLAADNLSDTYWAAPVEPTPPALVLRFGKPVELKHAIVRVGIGENFQAAHRPDKVHLVYSTGQTYDLTLADTPDQQQVEIGNSAGAEWIEVHVESVHRSLQGNEVAISEIEFFTVE